MGATQLYRNKMKENLIIYICEHFEADANAVLKAGDYADVELALFPTRCGRPQHTKEELSSL